MIGIKIWPSCWCGRRIDVDEEETEADRLIRIAHERVGPERSSFAFFFEPLLPIFSTLYWVSKEEEWPVRDDVKDEPGSDSASFDAMTDDGYFLPGVLFPRFKDQIIEDWATLIGTSNVPTSELCSDSEPLRNPQLCNEQIRIALVNIDGAYWYMFAHELKLTDAVRAHVEKLGSPFTADAADLVEYLSRGY